jgi:type I site-specific restriction endonuclease
VQERENQRIPALEKKLINLQTQLKSLALVPMTPMRTSSLKNTMENPRTPRPSKENINPRSRSASPRKPLKELANGIQPADLVREDTEEFVEQSKRMFRNIQVENEKLRQRVEHLETAKQQDEQAKLESMDQLQADLERLAKENHRLETLLQESQAAATHTLSSPRPRTASDEILRLSEELAWHAKLHLYAEKERMRLMDLVEFAAREGKFVVKEYVGLKEKVSKLSLRSDGVDLESSSGWKCLV